MPMGELKLERGNRESRWWTFNIAEGMQLTPRGQAVLWSRMGFSFFPLGFGSKQPIESWERWQHERPAEKDWAPWVHDRKYNLAVVCGEVSGNVVIQDHETFPGFEEFWGDHLDRILHDTLVVKTPHGGVHVYFRSREPCRRIIRLSESPPMDLLGEGGYAVSPPSIIDHAICDKPKCNLDGFGEYEVISVGYKIHEILDAYSSTVERCRDLRWKVHQGSRKRLDLKTVWNGVDEGARNESLFKYAIFLLNRAQLESPIVWNELERVNQLCRLPLDQKELQTLFQSATRSCYRSQRKTRVRSSYKLWKERHGVKD